MRRVTRRGCREGGALPLKFISASTRAARALGCRCRPHYPNGRGAARICFDFRRWREILGERERTPPGIRRVARGALNYRANAAPLLATSSNRSQHARAKSLESRNSAPPPSKANGLAGSASRKLDGSSTSTAPSRRMGAI